MKEIKDTVKDYWLVSILSILILVWVLKLWKADLRVPLSNGLDTIFNLMTIKAIEDNGWYFHNTFLGAPFSLDFHDLPMADSFNFILLKILVLFYDSTTALNLFFIGTFPLIAVSSFFAFRCLNISNSVSLVISLIYTFLPYHFLRGLDHIFLAAYYIIPLITLVILSLWSNDLPLLFTNGIFKEHFWKYIFSKKSVLYILVCLVLGSSGVYYAFFSCLFILVASISAFIYKKEKRIFFSAILLITLISSSVLLNVLPSIVYASKYGDNPDVAHRPYSESERFGLKIIHLLLPIENHRVPILKNLAQTYKDAKPPLQNENTFASLGIIGSIGFLSLLIRLVFFSVKTELTGSSPSIYDRLTILNISAVLFASIGGFGSIFALLVSPQIRGINRISIFIAFFSLLAIGLCLDSFNKKYVNNNFYKIIFNSLLFLLLLIGIFDQTSPAFIPQYSEQKKVYLSDQNFVRTIERVLPVGSMVFQLPYIPFPEHLPSVNRMADYDLFRGYLHSKNLRWSYGSMKGRNYDWHKGISEEPLDSLLTNISFVGFKGIYLDRYGYSDYGKQIEVELEKKLGTKPLVSKNERLAFFNMNALNEELRQRYSNEQIENYKSIVLKPTKEIWEKGFYGQESSLDKKWRWSNKQGTLTLNNPTAKAREVKINMSLTTGWSEYSNLQIESELFSDTIQINAIPIDFSKKILLPPGSHSINFSSDAKQANSSKDSRNLFFKVSNFKLKNEFSEDYKLTHLSSTELKWEKGFYEPDNILGERWRWSDKQSTLIIDNPTKKPRETKISIYLATGWSQYSNLRIESDLFLPEVVKINNKPSIFSKNISITPGRHTIQFSSDAKQVYAPQDARKLFFRVNEVLF